MKKNILIIDDSALMRRVLSDIISSDDRFTVKDYARDGLEGLDLIIKNKLQYDAVVMDINMPRMDGLEVLEQLQKHRIQVKIIMVSTLAKEGAKETIIALERGAFDFVTKPENYYEVKSEKFKNRLINTLVAATGFTQKTDPIVSTAAGVSATGKTLGNVKKVSGSKLIAIACSTGGPKSLKEVIPLLPEDIEAPILLVQHMPKGFTASLAARLNELSKVEVKEAKDGDVLKKGVVYLAPGGLHMEINQDKSGAYSVRLSDAPARDGLRPCANIMYESLAGSSYAQIICVVMTGMGSDGTEGIRQLSNKNNVYVISQDEASSVVYGMPRAVYAAGLSDEVVPLDKIAESITRSVGVHINGR